MEILEYIFLGMVQGLSEFLPISSSGHLKLFGHLFGYGGQENLFVSVMLHLGTLAAVVIVYRRLIGQMIVEFFLSIRDLFTGRFHAKTMSPQRRLLFMIIVSTAVLLVLLIPIGGRSIKGHIEALNSSDSLIPLGIAFMATGALLLFTFRYVKSIAKPRKSAKVKDALIIGGAQCVATISGVSRSGSTMCAGLLCGLDRSYMVKYSFIMSIPVILAAAASDAKDALQGEIAVDIIPLLFGIAASLFFGIVSIKVIQWLIKKDRYNIFGYYCAAIGLFTLVLGVCGV